MMGPRFANGTKVDVYTINNRFAYSGKVVASRLDGDRLTYDVESKNDGELHENVPEWIVHELVDQS